MSGPGTGTWVCAPCRRTSSDAGPCPRCSAPMTYAAGWAPPKRSDTRAWTAIAAGARPRPARRSTPSIPALLPHHVRTATTPDPVPPDTPHQWWTRHGLDAVMVRAEHSGVDDTTRAWAIRYAREGTARDRAQLVAWPTCPPDALQILLRCADPDIAAAALTHPGAPLTPRRLRSAARSSSTTVRAAAAAHPRTSRASLRTLSTDPDPVVASAAAANPRTPVDALLDVALERVPRTGVHAVICARGPAGVRTHLEQVFAILDTLADNPDVTVREALTVAGVLLS